MKTKIFVILICLVAVISFTALTSSGKAKGERDAESYQSSGGQTMSDPHQFD